jgi:AcrR family transcriptional regulator
MRSGADIRCKLRDVDAAERTRAPLTRERVLRAAVRLADERGIEALTMRNLGHELGVEAMSLYNHVSNKEDVLDGVVEVVVGEVVAAVEEIEPADWKATMRRRILTAREVLLRHRWAPAVLESRADLPPVALGYYDSLLGLMLEGGFSMDLAHHALHALGSRAFGFTQELFDTGDDPEPDELAVMQQQMARHYPNVAELMKVVYHDPESTLGGGCDDQFEFEFGLDLILDGLERLRDAAWDRSGRAA